MIIIGILASIAIPPSSAQRAKAHDASTKADVNHLGKEVATYFVDGSGDAAARLRQRPGSVVLTDGANTPRRSTSPTAPRSPSGTPQRTSATPQPWCVSLTDPRGSDQGLQVHEPPTASGRNLLMRTALRSSARTRDGTCGPTTASP